MCPSPAEGMSGKPVLFLFHMGNQSLKRQKQKHELRVCVHVRERQREKWVGESMKEVVWGHKGRETAHRGP